MKNEKIDDLVSIQKKLVVELVALAPNRDSLTNSSRYLFDLRLGECIGIELALSALGIEYVHVNDVLVW